MGCGVLACQSVTPRHPQTTATWAGQPEAKGLRGLCSVLVTGALTCQRLLGLADQVSFLVL